MKQRDCIACDSLFLAWKCKRVILNQWSLRLTPTYTSNLTHPLPPTHKNVHPSPPIQNISPPTPSYKKCSTIRNLPPSTHKKCPSTQQKYISTPLHPPISTNKNVHLLNIMFTHPHPPKIYLNQPPLTPTYP